MSRLIVADVIDGLRQLDDGSVHCVVTSPPYWGLRDYGTGEWEGGSAECDHDTSRGKPRPELPNPPAGWAERDATPTPGDCPMCGAKRTDKQLGLEPTIDEYVQRMVAVFAEVRRVLRDDGTVWMNMGDSYATSFFSHESVRSVAQPMGDWCKEGQRLPKEERTRRGAAESMCGLKPKDLCGIPWRVAFALQADGWYLRSDIIWAKPNPMPESVTDRPTKAHEYVFLLSKNRQYYYDAEAVREGAEYGYSMSSVHSKGRGWDHDAQEAKSVIAGNGGGRNKRDVWTIATQPYPEAHFATYPEALVKPCILAGTSERGCCSACGAPWVRVVESAIQHTQARNDGVYDASSGFGKSGWLQGRKIVATTGWQSTCTCNADTVPCTVLDPFLGSGTTALVAANEGREWVGIELNPEYAELARKRIPARQGLLI